MDIYDIYIKRLLKAVRDGLLQRVVVVVKPAVMVMARGGDDSSHWHSIAAAA